MSQHANGTQERRLDMIAAMESLPPLPAVALRVIQVAQDPHTSAADLAVVVSSDPGLSAQVLRMSNSAAYKRQRDATSIQEALVVLGFVQARNIAVSSAITSAFPPDSTNALFRIEEFWRHSLAVAFRASDVAAQRGGAEPATAFTAGILHNMGRLAIFHADPAGLDQAVAQVLRGAGTLEELEMKQLSVDHAAIGARLAKKWSLPAAIQGAILRHHTTAPEELSLPGVIAAADQFCMANGFMPGYRLPSAPDAPVPVLPAEAARLKAQVDQLTALIDLPAGVRIAS